MPAPQRDVLLRVNNLPSVITMLMISERLAATRGEATLDSDSGSDFGAELTPLPDDDDPGSALSDLSESEAEESDFGSDVPKRKGKGKGKGQGRFAGRGNRLDGGKVSDLPVLDLDGMDEETRIMTLEKIKADRREERQRWKEAKAPLHKKYAALKKEIGRKLTNGEKNWIQLSMVSARVEYLWKR